MPEVIETTRLRLRPWRLEDVDDVLAYAIDEQWARYLPVPQPYERRHAVEFLAQQVLMDGVRHPAWAIVLDERVVGGIGIDFDFVSRVGTFGYSIARPLWGQGLMTEAARAVVDAAFDVHQDLNRVQAAADERNVASWRVMEKLGMHREALLRENRVIRNEVTSEVWYGLLRHEWHPLR